ncbi:MAG: dTMP kinase [Betaproteobacteria bacterium]|nr:dTMP kinase [Betaproteobacteria bacterium]
MRGKFITLEGIDGAGKSTHLAWLAEKLRSRGLDVTVTREPGGTAVGENLRELLLDRAQRMHPETEAMLMFAARREHLDKVILPALARGTWVLCDRFSDATFAYQGGGSGVAWDKLQALEHWVQDGLQPDLTLYFDVPPEVGLRRVSGVRLPDRFEQERDGFYRNVREAYLRRAREFPERVQVLDGTHSVSEIQKELESIIASHCV